MARFHSTTLSALSLLAALSASGAAEPGLRPVEHRAYAAFCVGIQMSEARRYRDAVQWLEKALSLDPKSADTHIWLGLICDERLFRRNKAKMHFEKALQLAPDSFRARYGLARQLLRAGDFEKARREILLAIDTKLHCTISSNGIQSNP